MQVGKKAYLQADLLLDGEQGVVELLLKRVALPDEVLVVLVFYFIFICFLF